MRHLRKMRSFPKLAIPAFALACLIGTAQEAAPQTFAVIDPMGTEHDREAAARLRRALSAEVKVLDPSLAASAFRAYKPSNPFNLEAETARNIGSAIGCRFYVLVRGAVQRRSRFGRPEYYEAHAAFYLVNSVTGLLSRWTSVTFEEDTPALASERLYGASEGVAADLLSAADTALREDLKANRPEVSEEDESDVRPPMPYNRLRPEYTSLADLQGIEATVDIEVLIGSDGRVLETRITRWAGYGLDESVEKAVRDMQWRPAERKGEFLPRRVLLRYNFRDIKQPEI